MPSWAQALIRVIVALLEWWRERKTQKRVAAVRADPGSEWLRKFGGTDRRNKDASTGPEDAGGGGD
ncbi:hypothetical protein [Desulfovibrio sp. ZJ369]|uniref:hypothetical protein n=1 Tax=Desulfovibrio sp. ZJ369 TaxID=2709793 RepID=UPI0013EA2BFE|nr:hypothetical protein [Desulfovibrio sp. ZJ369]